MGRNRYVSDEDQQKIDMQRDAYHVINEKLVQAYAIIDECKQIAIENGVDFTFDVSYGMGGTFSGEEGEWHASSQSC